MRSIGPQGCRADVHVVLARQEQIRASVKPSPVLPDLDGLRFVDGGTTRALEERWQNPRSLQGADKERRAPYPINGRVLTLSPAQQDASFVGRQNAAQLLANDT